MAVAPYWHIGLENWREKANNLRRLPMPSRELAWLRQTPLWTEQEAWRGLPAFDRRGRLIGKVKDVLVETRTAEEAAEDGVKAWGVRAAYAVIRCRPRWRFWARSRELLVPARNLWQRDGRLHAELDAAELWPRLFGEAAA